MRQHEMGKLVHEITVHPGGGMLGVQNDRMSCSHANGRRRPAIGIGAQGRGAFSRYAGDLFQLPDNDTQMGGQFPGVKGVNSPQAQFRP